ncbi:MAG: hypothetical protein ACO23R_17675 [bacterium]|jgi:hypothetical protein
MKHEEKVGLATGAAVLLIAGPIAAMIGTPVTFGVLALGTYKLAKAAYEKAKPDIRERSQVQQTKSTSNQS